MSCDQLLWTPDSVIPLICQELEAEINSIPHLVISVRLFLSRRPKRNWKRIQTQCPHAFSAGPSPQWPRLVPLKPFENGLEIGITTLVSVAFPSLDRIPGVNNFREGWFVQVPGFKWFNPWWPGPRIHLGKISQWENTRRRSMASCLTGNRRQGGDGGPSVTLKRHNLMAYFLQLDPNS